MPSRNITKQFNLNSFYHIYNRVPNGLLFPEAKDYHYFLELLTKYLTPQPIETTKSYHIYPNFTNHINLNAFCLMPTHFHLLLYQIDSCSMSGFMKSLIGSYTRYYNKKYSKKGKLFETIYKAKLIENDSHLLHITRYIHLNPPEWETYMFSSYQSYFHVNKFNFLKTKQSEDLFKDKKTYTIFLKDYIEYQRDLEIYKYTTAG